MFVKIAGRRKEQEAFPVTARRRERGYVDEAAIPHAALIASALRNRMLENPGRSRTTFRWERRGALLGSRRYDT